MAASIGFGGVHAGVGDADDGVDGEAVSGRAGQADAGADFELEAGSNLEAGIHERAEQGGGMGLRGLGAGIRHEDDELIAAVAEAEIAEAAELAETGAGVGEQLTADEVTVGVVDELETVEVKEGEADGNALLGAEFEFAAEDVVEMAGVVESGAVVGDAQLLDAGDVARVFDGDGGVVGEDVEKGDGVIGHAVGAGIEDLE